MTFPVVVLVVLITQLALGYQNHRDQLRALEARSALLASLTAEAIAQPLWRLDRSIYEAQIRALDQDTAFARVRVFDEEGTLLFEHGSPAEDSVSVIRVEEPIIETSRRMDLGRLELEMSNASVYEDLLFQAMIGLAAFLVLLAGFFLVSHQGVNRLILRPLDRLLVAMGQVRDKQWVSLPEERSDELGQAYAAFNDMVQGLRSGDEAQRLLEQLERAHGDLERANQRIWESIHYARTIQEGMLPTPDALAGVVDELAVEWQPLHVVGGDFYWLEQRGGKALLLVADCTGHGVPGAFMTLLVESELRNTLDELSWDSPSAILSELDIRVRSRLKKADANALADDGLDAALCLVDRPAGRLTFAGASMNLLHFDGKRMHTVRGDRVSLGYQHDVRDGSLSDRVIPFRPGDSFYLMSDGVPDHMGELQKRLFGRGNVSRTLAERSGDSLREQLDHLRSALADYRGEEPRRDDLTIIAFRPAAEKHVENG